MRHESPRLLRLLQQQQDFFTSWIVANSGQETDLFSPRFRGLLLEASSVGFDGSREEWQEDGRSGSNMQRSFHSLTWFGTAHNPPPGRGRCIPFCLGFHSSTVAWQEYRLICEGLGRTPDQGIDAASFFKLVNEEWQIRSMHPT